MDKDSSRPARERSGITTHPADRTGEADPSLKGLHLAIGMFDGVHTGHQAVIRNAITTSGKDTGSISGVLTFDPHPSRILYPERATELIMLPGERIEQMLSLGLDFVFVQEFSLGYSRIEAPEFVRGLKQAFPGLKSLHVGENFRFGAGRSGGIDTMTSCAADSGLEMHVIERKMESGEPISSSRIRKLLAEGEMGQVGRMLGRPYRVTGNVIGGKRIGRTIGFPTLNIKWNREALPRFGVYRAWVLDPETGRHQLAVANFGLRPTVSGGEDPLLEVHLLDPESIPEPGSRLQVALTTYIRPEKAFASLEALREQIALDVDLARQLPDDGPDPSNFPGNGIARE